MKPFDREKALAGEPVITGDGFEVLELHYFPTIKKIIGFIEKCHDAMILTWNENGICDNNGKPSSYDLFMKPKKITKWYNVCYSSEYEQFYVNWYDDETTAFKSKTKDYLETLSIEIEE